MLAFPKSFKVKGTRIEDNEASIWIPGLGPGPGWGDDSKQACYTSQNVSSNSTEQTDRTPHTEINANALRLILNTVRI